MSTTARAIYNFNYIVCLLSLHECRRHLLKSEGHIVIWSCKTPRTIDIVKSSDRLRRICTLAIVKVCDWIIFSISGSGSSSSRATSTIMIIQEVCGWNLQRDINTVVFIFHVAGSPALCEIKDLKIGFTKQIMVVICKQRWELRFILLLVIRIVILLIISFRFTILLLRFKSFNS